MPRREKKKVLTLIHVLPDNGFVWFSLRGGKCFLNARLSREIAIAFKSLLPALTQEHVERAILKMFNAAINAIDGALKCTGEEFWAKVKKDVVWHRELDPRTILLFSWKVISAQVAYDELYKHHHEVETGLSWIEAELVPHSEAAQAVVNFGRKLYDSKTPFNIQRELIPSWTCDTNNEGDQESTDATFQRDLEKFRLREEALKAGVDAVVDAGVNTVMDTGVNTGVDADMDVDMDAEVDGVDEGAEYSVQNEYREDMEMDADEHEDAEMVNTVEGLPVGGPVFQLTLRPRQ